MKKFSRTIFGLLASAMLVAGSVSFVSCSDDDEEETTQAVEVKTTTNTVTINGTAYTYTTVDGKVQTSDSVTVSDDGTITIKADDGSYVTIKGTAITYTNAEGKSSSGTLGTESVTLTGDAGEISATSTSETKTETKTTGSGSEATASVTELAYDSDTLNNKVFSYDDDEIRYLTFTDGKCYKSDSSLTDLLNKEKDYLFISYNNKIYRSNKATRSSGSGLFATFDDGEKCKYTFKSDGTGIINFYDNSSLSFTFTNNAGLLTMSCTYEGETMTVVRYYNGEYLYNPKEELTFVKNYSAN